jgi:hypothetical protein
MRVERAALVRLRWTWQVMRAAVAVEAGDELCIGYVEVGAPAHVRRAALHKGYCFHCLCARCVQADQQTTTEDSADRTLMGLRCAARGCARLAVCDATAEACDWCGADVSALQVGLLSQLHRVPSLFVHLPSRRGYAIRSHQQSGCLSASRRVRRMCVHEAAG